jgi:hypothetical protein
MVKLKREITLTKEQKQMRSKLKKIIYNKLGLNDETKNQ